MIESSLGEGALVRGGRKGQQLESPMVATPSAADHGRTTRYVPVGRRQPLPQPPRHVGDFFHAHRVLHRVVAPLRRVTVRLELLARLESHRDRHHRIAAAMAQQDRHVRVCGRFLRGERFRKGQVARHREDARQPLGVTQARVQRDGAALRKSGQHDARGRYAALPLAIDIARDPARRLGGAGNVRPPGRGERLDVVPGPHHEPVVHRDRSHRRVRKHEAHRQRVGQAEFAHDRHEIMAIGAEPVQQDHRGHGRNRGDSVISKSDSSCR